MIKTEYQICLVESSVSRIVEEVLILREKCGVGRGEPDPTKSPIDEMWKWVNTPRSERPTDMRIDIKHVRRRKAETV
jgi:hypothetical protein